MKRCCWRVKQQSKKLIKLSRSLETKLSDRSDAIKLINQVRIHKIKPKLSELDRVRNRLGSVNDFYFDRCCQRD